MMRVNPTYRLLPPNQGGSGSGMGQYGGEYGYEAITDGDVFDPTQWPQDFPDDAVVVVDSTDGEIGRAAAPGSGAGDTLAKAASDILRAQYGQPVIPPGTVIRVIDPKTGRVIEQSRQTPGYPILSPTSPSTAAAAAGLGTVAIVAGVGLIAVMMLMRGR